MKAKIFQHQHITRPEAGRRSLPAIAGDGIPVAVGFGLVFGHHHEADAFVGLEHVAAVEAGKRAAADGEFHRQRIALFPAGEIGWRAKDRAHGAVGEGIGVEAGRFLGIAAHDFAAVVTDLRMKGLDGIQLCDRIVQSYPQVPVIVMTAFGSMDTAIQAIRAGAYDFLTKPVTPDVLTLAVRRALRQAEPGVAPMSRSRSANLGEFFRSRPHESMFCPSSVTSL